MYKKKKTLCPYLDIQTLIVLDFGITFKKKNFYRKKKKVK